MRPARVRQAGPMEEVEWYRRLGPPAPPRSPAELDQVAVEQRGLVTRAQCLKAGLSTKAVEVRLANGRWRRVHHGVYLTTPGRDDWWTYAVAAHLACGPEAAWSHRTAAFVWGLLASPPSTLEVLQPRDFAVRPPRGVTVRRNCHLDSRVDQLWWPWVTTAEDTVLDLAEVVELDELFALLGRAFQRQRTSEGLLLARLADRRRHSRRDLLREVMGDVATGAESTMEVRYIRDVERAHGLPRGERQLSASPTSAARHDVAYAEQRVLVELDGELGHEGRGARIRDGRRDRRGATLGWLTARAFWPDVLDACALALEVGAILGTRGWRGSPHRCRRRPCSIAAKPPSR
jgi:hypothetical protein